MSERAEHLVSLPANGVELEGELVVASGATGLVVFAHGSGSSRTSPRNTFVASVVRRRGLGTLLFDLLTEAEDATDETRFDIERLTSRLRSATDWLRGREGTRELSFGYFGSSTGAAVALRAAARRDDVDAVVSRGGRVDLAVEQLSAVTTPTLFVVGGADTQVLARNREGLEELAGPKALEVVEGAGHLFEGPGELETVAELAADWFEEHLRRP